MHSAPLPGIPGEEQPQPTQPPRLKTLARSGGTGVSGPAPGEDGRGRERTIWADTAKGMCILLVVLWHIVMKHYLQIDWRVSLPIPGIWGTLTEQLLPLRMPLFFTISGMFAVGAVNRPWRVLGRSKVAKFLYLYAVWLLIHTALLTFAPDFDTARADGLVDLLAQLTITPSNLWYLYALALYFALAKATRRLPTALVLAVALALSAVASAGLPATPGDRGGVYQNLVFFLAGLYFRPLVERLAAAATLPRLAVSVASYVGVLLVMELTGSRAWPGVWPAVCVVATILGVTAAAQISRWAPLGNALASLGRNTLPVYIIHLPLLALLHRALLTPLSADLDGRLRLLLAIVDPLVLTALVVWLCLMLRRALLKAGATWLFDLPKGFGPRARRTRPSPEPGAAVVPPPLVGPHRDSGQSAA